MKFLNLIAEVNGSTGYSTKLQLSDSELETLRKMVRIQWLYRLQILDPVHVSQFDDLGIEDYHQADYLIDHSSAWPKTSRVLPPDASIAIRKLNFMQVLKNEVGDFIISDEEDFGWENIYWRLVRPGNNDLGSLHADKWFWEIGEYGKQVEFPYERLKVWIPLYSVPEKNGLLVVPGSHKINDWKWDIEIHYGLKKPVIKESTEKIKPILLPLPPGNALVFHDSLIHGGANNVAEKTRVSMEFTLLIPNNCNNKIEDKEYGM